MAKITKVSDKLTKINDNFNINIFDNGFMVEASGKTADDDWATVKVMCSSEEELVQLVLDAISIEKDV